MASWMSGWQLPGSGQEGQASDAEQTEFQSLPASSAGVQPSNEGWPPRDEGWQPRNEGWQPSNEGWQPSNEGWQQPSNEGWQQPNNEGWQPNNGGWQHSARWKQMLSSGLLSGGSSGQDWGQQDWRQQAFTDGQQALPALCNGGLEQSVQQPEAGDEQLGQQLVLSYLLHELNSEDQVSQQQLQLQQQLQQQQEQEQQEQMLQEQMLQQQEQMLQQQLQPMAQSSGEGRELGTVEKFAPKRGFGLIQPDNGGDSIFAHWTQICSHDKWPQLSVGMRVEFTRVFEKGRPAAKSITMPGGGVVVAVEELMKNGRKLSPFTVCGTVAWFHRAGYGFIKLDTEMEWPQRMRAGQQVYVSREDLIVAEGSPCALEEGQRVQFKVFKPTDHNDVAAAEVTAEDGSPIVVKPTAITNARGWQTPPNIGTIIPTNLKLVPAKRALEGDDDAGEVSEEPAAKIRRLLQTGEVDLASMQAEQVQSIFGDASQHQQQQQQQQDPSKVRKFFGQTDEQLLQDLQRTIAAGEYSSSRGGGLASVPCKFHAQGRCARGAACPFSHRADLALALAQSMPPSEPPTRKVPCRFFTQGRCQKGDKCQFAHNAETPQPVPLEKKVPIECEYFAQARCTRAEACPFAHGPQELHEITILQALRNPGGFQPRGEMNSTL